MTTKRNCRDTWNFNDLMVGTVDHVTSTVQVSKPKEPYIWIIERRSPKDKTWKPCELVGIFFTRRLARATLKLYPWFSQSRTSRIRKYVCHTMQEEHKW